MLSIQWTIEENEQNSIEKNNEFNDITIRLNIQIIFDAKLKKNIFDFQIPKRNFTHGTCVS